MTTIRKFNLLLTLLIVVTISFSATSCGSQRHSYPSQNFCSYKKKKQKIEKRRAYPYTKEARKSMRLRARATYYFFDAGNIFGAGK